MSPLIPDWFKGRYREAFKPNPSTAVDAARAEDDDRHTITAESLLYGMALAIERSDKALAEAHLILCDLRSIRENMATMHGLPIEEPGDGRRIEKRPLSDYPIDYGHEDG